MTARHLTGDYPAGYTLSPDYRKLVIDDTADVGGVGISAAGIADVINRGAVYGSTQGVYLESGGSLTNGSGQNTSASIAGSSFAVRALGVAGVTNFGTLAAGSRGDGVLLGAGGTVANGSPKDTVALIAGYVGVNAKDRAAAIANLGTIRGYGAYTDAVALYAGGVVTNGSAGDTDALIQGESGVEVLGAAGVVANFGTIRSTGGYYEDGVLLDAGGSLTNGSANDAAALIAGAIGVRAVGDATIVNFGVIEGGNHNVSITLEGPGADLTAEAGSTFIGRIEGGGGALALAGGGDGTISGLGGLGTLTGAVAADFNGFGAYDIAAGGSWTLTGSDSLASGSVLTDEGTLIDDGALTIAGAATISASAVFELAGGGIVAGPAGAAKIVNDGLMIKNAGVATITVGAQVVDGGVVEVASGTLDLTGHLLGAGVLKIDGGATLEADTAAVSTLSAIFDGPAATLALKLPNAFHATLGGLVAGDVIDLLGHTATGAGVNADDQLVIVDGARTVSTLQLSGNYVGAVFATKADGQGGTDVTLVSAPEAAHASVQAMAAAMASLVRPTGEAAPGRDFPAGCPPVLANPHLQLQ